MIPLGLPLISKNSTQLLESLNCSRDFYEEYASRRKTFFIKLNFMNKIEFGNGICSRHSHAPLIKKGFSFLESLEIYMNLSFKGQHLDGRLRSGSTSTF